jgi:hypothetical protein
MRPRCNSLGGDSSGATIDVDLVAGLDAAGSVLGVDYAGDAELTIAP